MTIGEYFGDWSKVADLQEADRITRKLTVSHKAICLAVKDIFKCFRLCSLDSLRVVIMGQDPYPSNMATGLAFANDSSTPDGQIPPSLEILRESVINYTIPHGLVNFDLSLEKWERQGVLLLNSALSCEQGKPGSHALLWWPFIRSLLTNLSEYHTGIVYLLMGNVAQSFETCINRQHNHVVHIRHPSWYARQRQRMPSGIWQEVNNILISQNGTGTEWYQEY